MKKLLLVIVVVLGLSLPAVAQEPARMKVAEPAKAEPARVKKSKVSGSTADVGICLNGEKVRIIRGRGDAKNCESVFWMKTHTWAQNQRTLLDKSASGTLSAGQSAVLTCKTCTGICQIVSWVNGQSKFEGADAGGGMSPSECVDAITEICGSGYSSYFFGAQCGN